MENNELKLAWNFVNQTKRHIFLTGKAGTGKTTFLHKLKKQSPKRLAVVAPTGVAAINARGVTIHSFFQMPFGPILPDEAQQNIQRDYKQKFSKKKRTNNSNNPTNSNIGIQESSQKNKCTHKRAF